jgi:hypothetical protein
LIEARKVEDVKSSEQWSVVSGQETGIREQGSGNRKAFMLNSYGGPTKSGVGDLASKGRGILFIVL